MNRLDEAEELFRQALGIVETRLGSENPSVATALSNLAAVLRDTRRLDEAEPLIRRAMAINQWSFGPESPNFATNFRDLGHLLFTASRPDEAEPFMRQALTLNERFWGPDHLNIAGDLNNLAVLLIAINRVDEAQVLSRRALAIYERVMGPTHPDVATTLRILAVALQTASRIDEAEPLMRRALTIDEARFGPEHPEVANDLIGLAVLRALRGDWSSAATLSRRAKLIIAERRPNGSNAGRDFARAALLVQSTTALRLSARAVHRESPNSPAALDEGFELAQWALQNVAGEALAQMSVRFAKGEGLLARLIRERQDLIARRHDEMRRLYKAAGEADLAAATETRSSIAKLDKSLDALDAQVAANFKDYAELASPKPLTIGATQALLKDDEALVLLLDVPAVGALPEETLLWFITKQQAHWHSIPLGTQRLGEHVAALRCGLASSLWDDERTHNACQKLVKAQPQIERIKYRGQDAKVRVLPFDLGRAHQMYQALFGPVDDKIQGKHVFIVASGALTSLPFGVLVTRAPRVAIPGKLSAYRDPAWLGVRQRLSVLPSVASLKALRQFAKSSHATKPYLGIGNPLVDGTNQKRAKEAEDKQKCPETITRRIATARIQHVVGFAELFRGSTAKIEELRKWEPLPETADELCEIGQRLGASEKDILLGARATEANLKELSEQGRLTDYAILGRDHPTEDGRSLGWLGREQEFCGHARRAGQRCSAGYGSFLRCYRDVLPAIAT